MSSFGIVAGLVFFGLALGLTTLTIDSHQARARKQAVVGLLQDLNDTDAALRETARNRLRSQPEVNGPVLVEILAGTRTRWHDEILPALDGLPLLVRHSARQLQLDRDAIDGLLCIGLPAAPHLVPLLADGRFGGRDIAIPLLRSFGIGVRPILLQALEDPDPRIREGALRTLGKFPSEQLESLEPLRQAARDPHPEVRAAAIWALAQMLDRAEQIVPDLVRALEDSAPEVRIQASASLRYFTSPPGNGDSPEPR
ncbi:MAG: HEAT repeat domain-containing protein [Limisphaerales bacterium]